MKSFFLFALLFFFGCAQAQNAPKIAVWDPEFKTSETRFAIDLDYLATVSTWLQQGGAAVTRVTASQIADPAQFSAQRFDAIFFPGDSFLLSDAKALQNFTAQGGVLVALNGRVPFANAIAEENGSWVLTPKEPKFAWQKGDIYYNALGIKYIYNTANHNLGLKNTSTSILKKYLPAAPDIIEKLPSNWIVPTNLQGVKTEYYPLVRSQRGDGLDTTPQLYITKNGKRTGIIASNDFYTANTRPEIWPLAKETVVALAQIAADLKSGKLQLDPKDAINLPENQAPPEPLRTRFVKGSVEPDGAKPLVRWGQFDGANYELGEPLKGEKTLEVGAKNSEFPRRLEAGATLKLNLPALPDGAKWLRVRGAYEKSNAALKADFGAQTVWNESLNYVESGGAGNPGAPELAGVAAEFQRSIFLPGDAKTLTLSNPGTQPLYFDAVQIEARPTATRTMRIGLNAPFVLTKGGATSIPSEVSQTWGSMRATWGSQYIGAPDDPKRWETTDAIIEKFLAMGAPLELLIEGTPAWAAKSPERLKTVQQSGRPWTVAPDIAKFSEIVTRQVNKYKDKVDVYEIWNEADSDKYYVGSDEEYVELFNALAPLIRKLDPGARVGTTGMAGYREGFVDALIRGHVVQNADFVALHPYAGKGQGWDVPFGQLEGTLYANGISTEIYCNESGFPWRTEDWFIPPPQQTPALQAEQINKAMARLLATDLNKLSVFHAGGDSHPYGLWDEKGRPRPAYAAFADYLSLSGGERVDISLAAQDGSPLSGVYTAAARQKDGEIAIVVNPAENPLLENNLYGALRNAVPEPDSGDEFDGNLAWTTFFGTATYQNGQLTLAPYADKNYVGSNHPFTLDVAKRPILEINAVAAQKPWSLSLKVNGKQLNVATDQKAGVYRADLRPLLAPGSVEAELTIRAQGAATFDYLRFSPDEGKELSPGSPKGQPLAAPRVAGLSATNSLEMAPTAGWQTFFGKPSFENDTMILTPDAGKTYTGAGRDFAFDPVALPMLEIAVPASEKGWNATMKGPDGQIISVAPNQQTSVFKVDLRDVLPNLAAGKWNLTIRGNGVTTVEKIQFSPGEKRETKAAQIPIVLRVPLPNAGAWKAKVGEKSVPMEVKTANGVAWGEIAILLENRVVVTLAP